MGLPDTTTRRLEYIDVMLSELRQGGCSDAVTDLPGACPGCAKMRDLQRERTLILTPNLGLDNPAGAGEMVEAFRG